MAYPNYILSKANERESEEMTKEDFLSRLTSVTHERKHTTFHFKTAEGHEDIKIPSNLLFFDYVSEEFYQRVGERIPLTISPYWDCVILTCPRTEAV